MSEAWKLLLVVYSSSIFMFYGIIQICFIVRGIRNPLYRPVTARRNSPQ
ncbi:MAG: hypothetical protein ABIJ56_12820 [Pseudomonadota bacterium]